MEDKKANLEQEELNQTGITEDYNDQGIDVIALPKQDSDNCIFTEIKEKIQNAPNLSIATMESENIINDSVKIIEQSKFAKIKKEEKKLPETVKPEDIQNDINENNRTKEDVEITVNNFETLDEITGNVVDIKFPTEPSKEQNNEKKAKHTTKSKDDDEDIDL